MIGLRIIHLNGANRRAGGGQRGGVNSAGASVGEA